jgi:hypothetical protein
MCSFERRGFFGGYFSECTRFQTPAIFILTASADGTTSGSNCNESDGNADALSIRPLMSGDSDSLCDNSRCQGSAHSNGLALNRVKCMEQPYDNARDYAGIMVALLFAHLPECMASACSHAFAECTSQPLCYPPGIRRRVKVNLR